tara:strand:+ start:113 stop:778 length:666 start_codon:yes stop_codon:yes gene_type:complete
MYKQYLKPFFDYLFSLIIVFVLSPIFIPIIIILFFTGENHVFYLQDRVGFKNKIFRIIKFATMKENSPNMGTGSLTLRNDPRVLPVGKYLRKTKINEFPQLFNILNGTMSLIGPRPQMKVDFLKFPIHIQNKIYDIKPGLSGIGSIIFRDEEKIISDFQGDKHIFYKNQIAPYKGELEIWYQNNISFTTDLKLFFCTILVVFFPNSNLINKFFKNLPENPF